MSIDPALKAQLSAIFEPLKTQAAAHAFPPPASLSQELTRQLKHAVAKKSGSVNVDPAVAKLFATAAVDAWLRGVHSFLISAALTETSPIWASVSGYYSSHYTVRAFAHLLGHFYLFRAKQLVQLELVGGKFVCAFGKQSAREHDWYWKTVKAHGVFKGESLFTDNDATGPVSDAAHRNYASYADHLMAYAAFAALSADAVKIRIGTISQIEFQTPPIPNAEKFPDLESVQVVAYHRIVRFRRFLDEVLGGKNRFWLVHRNPSWSSGLITFQLTQPRGLPAAFGG